MLPVLGRFAVWVRRGRARCRTTILHYQSPPNGNITPSKTDRSISSQTARRILGLSTLSSSSASASGPRLNATQLRQAYLQAAKQCHPDVSTRSGNGASHRDFLLVTQAYERLQQELNRTTMGIEYFTAQEESSSSSSIFDTNHNDADSFRTACEQQLGLPAEIVEECKQNAIFRTWLHNNNSHWAQIWRTFLAGHGGWAPQLPVVAGTIGPSPQASVGGPQRRRRRKR